MVVSIVRLLAALLHRGSAAQSRAAMLKGARLCFAMVGSLCYNTTRIKAQHRGQSQHLHLQHHLCIFYHKVYPRPRWRRHTHLSYVQHFLFLSFLLFVATNNIVLMARATLLLLGGLLLSLVLAAPEERVPAAVSWSLNTYGPDGPWHAITVQIGGPPQSVDLLPGGFWQSNVFSPALCLAPTVCSQPLAGFYNDTASSSSIIMPPNFGPLNGTRLEELNFAPVVATKAEVVYDFLYLPTGPDATWLYTNFTMIVISQNYETLPDGTKFALEIGNLALGAPNITTADMKATILGDTGSILNTQFQDFIPSNSFGMHIGSPAMAIPPSLYLGGYDQLRVLGEPSVQRYTQDYLPIDLLDVGIGVAEGESPFSFTSKSGLLASGNSSIGLSMEVLVDPTAPFIYLPKSSCDAIAANLPVTYQPNLGLYFWDTTSPAYHEIISSPAFLDFTFRQNGSLTQNITINVPFSLLNLTLTSPLVDIPTPYFPCNPVGYGKVYPQYTLGRAFLQAAFVGVNWQYDGLGNWFLAQAPGPNLPTQPIVTSIGLNDAYIVPSMNLWADTWRGSWAPIAAATTTNPARSHLSKGAIAGIAVGAVVVGLIVIAGAAICWRTTKSKKVTNSYQHAASHDLSNGHTRLTTLDKKEPVAEVQGSLKRALEIGGKQLRKIIELNSERDAVELPANDRRTAELPGQR